LTEEDLAKLTGEEHVTHQEPKEPIIVPIGAK